MAPAEFGEYLFGGERTAMRDIILALSDRLVHISACGDVEQSLALFHICWRCWLLVLLQINSQCDRRAKSGSTEATDPGPLMPPAGFPRCVCRRRPDDVACGRRNELHR